MTENVYIIHKQPYIKHIMMFKLIITDLVNQKKQETQMFVMDFHMELEQIIIHQTCMKQEVMDGEDMLEDLQLIDLNKDQLYVI
jgi:hypothetical protein